MPPRPSDALSGAARGQARRGRLLQAWEAKFPDSICVTIKGAPSSSVCAGKRGPEKASIAPATTQRAVPARPPRATCGARTPPPHRSPAHTRARGRSYAGRSASRPRAPTGPLQVPPSSGGDAAAGRALGVRRDCLGGGGGASAARRHHGGPAEHGRRRGAPGVGRRSLRTRRRGGLGSGVASLREGRGGEAGAQGCRTSPRRTPARRTPPPAAPWPGRARGRGDSCPGLCCWAQPFCPKGV